MGGNDDHGGDHSMAFSINKRSRQQPEIAIADAPEQRLADAEAALDALLGEQAQVRQALAEHQQRRGALMRDAGDVAQIVALEADECLFGLRLEQINLQLPAAQIAVQQARADVHEAAWRDYRPVLVHAEQQLATAIGNLFDALARVHDAHGAAHRAGFGGRLGEFIRPPPAAPVSDYALREFQKHAALKTQPATLPATDFTMALDEAPMDLPPARRFTPRRVPYAEIVAISAIAPPRAVRILHGPVKTSNLHGVGIARMFEGERHIVPARAAYALVHSGIAEYAEVAEGGRGGKRGGIGGTAMNSSDWIAATGNPLVGRGPYRRPINPRLVAAALGKTAPPRRRPGRGAAYRRLMLEIARLSTSSDIVPMRYRNAAGRRQAYLRTLRDLSGGRHRDTSIFEQSRVGPEGGVARMQHTMAVLQAMR